MMLNVMILCQPNGETAWVEEFNGENVDQLHGIVDSWRDRNCELVAANYSMAAVEGKMPASIYDAVTSGNPFGWATA